MSFTMKNNTNIQYRHVGAYNIPNLILPPEEANITLGKWGMLHKIYLMKHKKMLFTTLLTQGKLYQYCAEVEKQAKEIFEFLIKQIKVSETVTEELKEQKQWEWVQILGNIQQQAKEIVLDELIYK